MFCCYDYFARPGRSHRKAHIAWVVFYVHAVCFWESGSMGCFGLETGVLDSRDEIWSEGSKLGPWEDMVRAKGEGCVRVRVWMNLFSEGSILF